MMLERLLLNNVHSRLVPSRSRFMGLGVISARFLSTVQHDKLGSNNKDIKTDPKKQWNDNDSRPFHTLPHPIWDLSKVSRVEQTHEKPNGVAEKIAFVCVKSVRTAFDIFTGYSFGIRGEAPWVRRIIFLETVAGVPGMVGGMIRHMRSLRKMEKDGGWIHTLLEEAENERMHLMIALALRKPGALFRGAVLGGQFFFFSFYWLCYVLSPRFCHKFVGYLEEEAVRTYSHLLSEIDGGNLPVFSSTIAPGVAREYYRLSDNASLRDVFVCMRADESHHRDVNHTFAKMGPQDVNPFPPGH